MPSVQPSDFFVFNLPSTEDPRRAPDVVVFTGGTHISTDVLVDRLRAHLERNAPPGRILLLASAALTDRTTEVAAEERLRDTLPAFTRWSGDQRVVPLAFNEQGRLKDLSGKASETEGPDFAWTLSQTGLRMIFEQRNGLLEAGSGYHFVNPSGVHTTAFIRTGNVLLHSAEIAFLAMGLLKWWPDDLERIFVDSASISSVAYALVDLRRAFDPQLRVPSIDSFSSYQGLQAFGFQQNALCLISASISGQLEDRIVAGGTVEQARIVTLFYGGERLQGRRILCDLVQDHGFKAIRGRADGQCELCERGSDIVRFSGDQFLPANPTVDEVLLRARDTPHWLPTLLSTVVGQRIVRCHATTQGAPLRDIYLHLAEALAPPEGDSTPLGKALAQQLASAVPVSLGRIIHSPDPSSAALAKAVKHHFEAAARRVLPCDTVLNWRDVRAQEEPPEARGSVVVVSSVLSSGRALLGISQYLRKVVGAASIVYIVGIARPASEADWKRVRSSLTWGDARPNHHPLITLAFGHLPRDRTSEPSPWQTEIAFLQRLRTELGGEDREAVEAVSAREALLSQAESTEPLGLVDDLFLPSVQNGQLLFCGAGRLRLRPGWAFWSAVRKSEDGGTQAEVYFTIAAILHALRSGDGGQPALVQHEHNRTVLSPDNFVRFNDGVIQAALLRAARPRELDFDGNEALSGRMRDIVRNVIDRRGQDEGEAAPEFILALAQDRLRLEPGHMRDLCTHLNTLDVPPFMCALRTWMRRRLTSCRSERDPATRD